MVAREWRVAAEGPSGSLISLEAVSKRFPADGAAPVTAVDTVDLRIEPNEFVMVTGRSGSGKTTLLNLAAGLATPSAGRVLIDGEDVWGMSDRQRTRLRNEAIGFVFQFPSLVPTLTVAENVMLPAAFRGRRDGDDPEVRALGLLKTVGIEDKARVYPRHLSAGQQQRVVLARSLMNRPRIILADEPSSNLDEHTEQEIMGLFRKVHERTGVTIVMVTHTSGLLANCTRAVRMAAGRIESDEPAMAGTGSR